MSLGWLRFVLGQQENSLCFLHAFERRFLAYIWAKVCGKICKPTACPINGFANLDETLVFLTEGHYPVLVKNKASVHASFCEPNIPKFLIPLIIAGNYSLSDNSLWTFCTALVIILQIDESNGSACSVRGYRLWLRKTDLASCLVLRCHRGRFWYPYTCWVVLYSTNSPTGFNNYWWNELI